MPDALALAQAHQLSAAVLDVLVGTQDVFPVASCLAERGVPFLFHTGHANAAKLNERWPNAPVLAKPVAPGQLTLELGRLVNGVSR